jgi:predicted nucleotidyltransferase
MAETAGAFNVEACRRNLEDRERRRREQSERRRAGAFAAVKEAVQACAPRYESVRRVFLFGSVTREGAFRTVSDVDVAVEGAGAADYFAFWRDLERAAPGWTVDLRDLVWDSHFSERIRTGGILVYEREAEGAQG